MKVSVLVMLCASLAAGAIGAFIASVTLTPAPAPLPVVERTGPSTLELQREIQDVRDENASLLRRVAMLEDRPSDAPTRTPLPAGPAVEAAPVEPELARLVAALKDPSAPVPENLQATVGEALKKIRADEERARRDQQAELASQRIEERLQVLTDKLGLAPRQTNQMRDLLTTQAAKRDELWRTVRDSGDFMSSRDAMREMRTSMDTGLAEILTPVQLDEFKKLDAQDRGFETGIGPFRRPGNRGDGE